MSPRSRVTLLYLALAPPVLAQGGASREGECSVCHRAAVRSLEASSHRVPQPDRASVPDPLPRFIPGSASRRDASCVACHGADPSHAADAKARRVRPGSFPIPAGACEACHREPARAHRGVKEFRPERACESCHRIHVPAAPRAEEPVRGGGRGREEETAETRVGPFAVKGFVEAGWRAVARSGDEGQFAQDVNLSPGARLLGARLEGRAREEAPVDSFFFSARGIGEPRTAVEAGARREERWRARAAWRRDEFVWNSDSDFHAREGRREELAFDLSTDARRPGDPSAGLDFVQSWRRGGERGTLFFPSIVGRIGPTDLLRPPTDRVELTSSARTYGASGRFEVAGFGVFLRPEFREYLGEPQAHLGGSAPISTSPSNATITDRDLDGEVRTRSPALTARVFRPFGEGAGSLDVGFRFADTRADSDLAEHFEYVSFTVPHTADTIGHSRSEGRLAEIDAQVRFRAREDVELRLRGVRREEDQRSRYRSLTFVDPTGPPTLPAFNETRLESLVWAGQVELRLRVTEPLDFRFGGEGFRQDLDFTEGPPDTPAEEADAPNHLSAAGPFVGATLRPARGWAFDLDVSTADALDTFHEIQPDEAYSVRGRVRGRFGRELAMTLHARRRFARTEGFEGDFGYRTDSRRRLDSAAVTLDWTPRPGLAASAGFGVQEVALNTEIAFVPAFFPPQSDTEFQGTVEVLTASLGADLLERLRGSASLAYDRSMGDAAFRFQDLSGRIEYEIAKDLVVGTELRFVEFAPHVSGPGSRDGYDALLGLLFTRLSF